MKWNRSNWIAFALLIVVSAVSRLVVFHVAGLAPQIAMAIFGAAIVKDRKWAFGLPLLSLLLSDLLMQVLFQMGALTRAGFYDGQWATYLCFAIVTLYGFLMKKINLKNIFFFSISGGLLFFLLSNFFVWIGGGGFARPLTFNGLLLCYGDALAYYRDYGLFKGFPGNFLVGDVAWSLVLFGGYWLINKLSITSRTQTA